MTTPHAARPIGSGSLQAQLAAERQRADEEAARADAAESALRAACAHAGRPWLEPPPEYVTGYESPTRKFMAVTLQSGEVAVISRNALGKRTAGEAWQDAARHVS